MRTVNENLELIRSYLGITKRSLAVACGLSEMQCSRILWGETKLTADMAHKFANCLGISDMNVIYDDKLTDSVICGVVKN